jgi:hypothetical protein
MFEDWMCQADLEYIHLRNMISIEPTYCLLPEGDSKVLRSNRIAIRAWMFQRLQEKLHTINRHLVIDWGNFYMFGVSFGGLMAIETFLEIGHDQLKPTDLRVRKVLLRSPITHEYSRVLGDFMGRSLSREKALADSDRVLRTIDQAPWLIPRAGSTPPFWMYGAPIFAGLDRFNLLYKGRFPYDNIEDAHICPDERTHFLFKHGDADQHVKLEDSKRTVDLLQTKWPLLTVHLEIQLGKPHAWDYSQPLSEQLKYELDL